jgi:hypothetical protein
MDNRRVGIADRAWGIGSGIVYENAVIGGVIPKEYLPAVEKGA